MKRSIPLPGKHLSGAGIVFPAEAALANGFIQKPVKVRDLVVADTVTLE